jgi:AhpD family alkylhydroperoxidase
MEERMSFAALPKGLVKVMMQTDAYLRESRLPVPLVEIVRMRVSQINGCAFCLDMHHKEAVHAGVPLLKLYTLPAWRDSPAYDANERLALELAEGLTTVTSHPPDELFERALEHFGAQDFADLSLVITQINNWNRMVTAFRFSPGNYRVAA